ncbi:MAG: hypothetical protein ACRC35_01895 [Angustibacter sp.]
MLLATATATADPTRRRQAAALARAADPDTDDARRLLARSFLDVIAPSFHLIPRGSAMASEGDFQVAYRALDEATEHFTRVDYRPAGAGSARRRGTALPLQARPRRRPRRVGQRPAGRQPWCPVLRSALPALRRRRLAAGAGRLLGGQRRQRARAALGAAASARGDPPTGESPSALLDVVLATDGRTYSLSTLGHLVAVPEIAALRGTRPHAEPGLHTER